MILEHLQDLKDSASVLALALIDGEGNVVEKWSEHDIKEIVFGEMAVDFWQIYQIYQNGNPEDVEVVIGHKTGQIIARYFNNHLVLVLCRPTADISAISIVLTACLVNIEKDNNMLKQLKKTSSFNFLNEKEMDDVEAEFYNRLKLKYR